MSKDKIRSLARRQIIAALEEDLQGGESLMKEVWEQCETDADVATAKGEMEAIVGDIQRREALEDWQRPSRDGTTAHLVASFSTYPLDALLNELVMCTVRYNLGDLDGEERRIATAVLERMASFGIARKVHREGCEVWPEHRLCRCPWAVPS